MLHTHTSEILGTRIQITINTPTYPEKSFQIAINEFKRIEQKYSRFQENNTLHHLNTHLKQWTNVDPETYHLLKTGHTLQHLSHGHFNLTVKSILDSWGYNSQYQLDTETNDGNIGFFDLDETNQSVFLTAPIEFGAIGKGHALDQVQKKLNHHPNLFINAGGDLYARGITPHHQPWTCYLEDPHTPSTIIGETSLQNTFISGSSARHRQWRNRHHLINAQSQTLANQIIATWVMSTQGILSDGLATTLFVSDPTITQNIIKQQQLNAIVINTERKALKTGTLSNILY